MNNKNTTIVLLSLTFLFVSPGAFSDQDDDEYKGATFSRDKKTLIKVNLYSATLIDPQLIRNNNIAPEDMLQFLNKHSTKVFTTHYSVPAQVVSIRPKALDECSRLKTITLNRSIGSIPSDLFVNCKELEEIKLHCDPFMQAYFGARGVLYGFTDYEWKKPKNPNDPYGNIERSKGIALVAYPQNRAGFTYEFPTTRSFSITSIGDYAFYKCINLNKVILPESIQRIGYKSFSDCYRLWDIHLGESITHIEDFAFNNCVQLGPDINMPKNVDHIGSSVFKECYSLQNIIVSPQNKLFKDIDGVLLTKDETKLITYPAGKKQATYVVPPKVTHIEANAFEYSKLEHIQLPNGIQHIDGTAFSNCKTLKTVTIPKGINIDTSVFGKEIDILK